MIIKIKALLISPLVNINGSSSITMIKILLTKNFFYYFFSIPIFKLLFDFSNFYTRLIK